MLSKRRECFVLLVISFCVSMIAGFFLFYNLGHHSLWDDEAICVLFGRSVWQTGDTSATLDHNIIAFNHGAELDQLKMRYVPPLQFYVVAPFVGSSGTSTAAVRFPFAVCGFLTVMLLLRWLWKSSASLQMWVLMSVGLLGNVSFFLFARQARYYSLSMLLSLLLVYLYHYRDHRLRTLLSLALVAILLLSANYLNFVALCVILLFDYFFWGRKEKVFHLKELCFLLSVVAIIGGGIVCIHNPLGKNVWQAHASSHWFMDKTILLLWNFRELNSCELGAGILLLMAPLVYRWKKDVWILRGFIAICVYVVVTVLFSPQPLNLASVAFVRYLAPLIPLCIFVAVLTIRAIGQVNRRFVVPVAILAFGTNLLHGGPFVGRDPLTDFSSIYPSGQLRSSIVLFVEELLRPPQSTRRELVEWMSKNISAGDSIWVQPGYETYPLMYHAPQFIYAWQLLNKQGQFQSLPDIHFKNQDWPTYLVAFGPYRFQVEDAVKPHKTSSVHYDLIAQIDRYWYELNRPELIWHSFRDIVSFNREDQGVYIYKKREPLND
ncbi:MAG: hypothetical protein K8S27_04975 [Candidatus Omnitrophica bacterium]|nr:hypothetical protein [Candidatus Omnitrophota bacterium]